MTATQLQNAFNPHLSWNKQAAFVSAAFRGDLSHITEILEKYNACISEVIDRRAGKGNGWTALTAAAERGHMNIVKLLLQNGAIVDRKNSQDWTALLLATKNGDENIVELLLENGADPSKKDKYGDNALFYAARRGDIGIAGLLLEKGADVEQKNKSGITAAELARRNDNPKMASWLEEWPREQKRLCDEKKAAQELAEDIADFSPALKRPIPRSRPFKVSVRSPQ